MNGTSRRLQLIGDARDRQEAYRVETLCSTLNRLRSRKSTATQSVAGILSRS